MNNTLKYGSAGIVGAILGSVIALEGGYVNDPYDPGGETKYGITKDVALAYGYKGEMKDLPISTAQIIYTDAYVNRPHYNLLLDISPAIAHKLVDIGVNAGTGRSSIWFQKAINSLSNNGQDYPKIREDGVIGTNTINSYKKLLEKRGAVKGCQLVLKLLDAQQASFYMSLDNLSRYTTGWIDNRIGNISLSQCSKYESDFLILKEDKP